MVYLDPLPAANSENQILIITKEVWFMDQRVCLNMLGEHKPKLWPFKSWEHDSLNPTFV